MSVSKLSNPDIWMYIYIYIYIYIYYSHYVFSLGSLHKHRVIFILYNAWTTFDSIDIYPYFTRSQNDDTTIENEGIGTTLFKSNAMPTSSGCKQRTPSKLSVPDYIVRL